LDENRTEGDQVGIFARAAALAAAVVMTAGLGTAAAEQEAEFTYEAEQGAWPVSGQAGAWGNLDIREYQNALIVDGENNGGRDWARLELNAAGQVPLEVGTYTDVRNRLQHPDGPGILLVANGFGCWDDYATFTVERIERAEGRLTGLDATVEQHCGDPAGPAFRARLHYDA
jgi:hypothetical protein